MEELIQLVLQAQTGDLEAYSKLVRRFQDMAVGYARSLLGDFHLAEDAVQEAFVAAYQDLGKLRQPAAFAGWFRRIVFICCQRQRRRRGPTVDLEQAGPIADDDQDPAERAVIQDLKTRVLDAIDALPAAQRQLLRLFYFDGFSQGQIAALLEVPLSTANNRLHASRKRLRRELAYMKPQQQAAPFVHLRLHSEYSFVESAGQIAELARQAAHYRMPALAITDPGNLFGAVEHYQVCAQAGVKPIIGCELTATAEDGAAGGTLVLLAKNDTGYKNLVKLVSRGYLEGNYRSPQVDRATLQSHADGLIALAGGPTGQLTVLLQAGQSEAARRLGRVYKAIFNGDFYLEIQRPDPCGEALAQLGRQLQLPLVATSPTTALAPLESPTAVAARFADLPQALENTLNIAAQCDVQFDFGELKLPAFPDLADFADAQTYLTHLAEQGLAQRYNHTDQTLRDRLQSELATINGQGYAPYFLIVWDCVQCARRQGIAVGPGRGSAVGCLVAYTLGITDIDPIKYNLFFERFMNPQRPIPPDIDIDLDPGGRDQLIDYIADKYGQTRVSQVVAFARRPDYSAHQASAHPAGLVIAPGELTDFVPLYKKSEKGRPISQFDGRTCEELGLLKLDFLGLKELALIDQTVRLIRDTTDFDLDTIPWDDRTTFELFGAGQTVGIFQFDSHDMGRYLTQLKPDTLEDLIALNALYRPATEALIPTYIARKRGEQPTSCDHPALAPIVASTAGLLIYQEQIIQAFQDLAGRPPGQGYMLIKAVAKERNDEITQQRQAFIEGCGEEDIEQKAAGPLFAALQAAAPATFNRSHAVAYTTIAYRCAYLKAHYPRAFMNTALKSNDNPQARAVLLDECRRLGLDPA
ncbi:MAG: sigma-70 family RNA polymerase sigma factor [Candidatus Latescibacteria bacterium]|nr:sigma-70 family RNA polymerase sigma factor [Candidatus Latescibacterota bacterium]